MCCLSDPEEFLTVVMNQILALEPLLKLYNRSTAVKVSRSQPKSS